ncbi:MAG: hypothetical protein NW226_20020 [Microscillaceae bacterium]|nr:hypothetical protein [Microscillaceae bacterium]
MKNVTIILLTITLSFLSLAVQAQTEAPKVGFTIQFSPAQATVKAGDTQTVEATIIRSKKFANSDIDLKVMPLAQGLQVEVAKNDADHFTLTLKADAGLNLGDYTVTIMGKSPLLNKGALLGVKVVSKDSIAGSGN